MNPCIEIYKASGESVRYGNDSGICRITGIQGTLNNARCLSSN